MTATAWGRSAWAALFLAAATSAQAGPVMQVIAPNERMLAQLPFNGAEICLEWAHSVTGGAVVDCFVAREGAMVLSRSYLHDFAAGLGEVLGRGTLTSAEEGGYWIVGIDEVIPSPGLPLRVGPPRVGHLLRGPEASINLSELAPNQRVTLQIATD